VSLPLVIDMNLSPEWVGWFERHGWPAVHWSAVGDPRATDVDILGWASAHHRVLFTNDLDFGAVLASSGGLSPSVVQLRTNDVTPAISGAMLLEVLTLFEGELQRGALVTLEEDGGRVRVLPLRGA
jgi:predicted nuclease of predicted toxin-antitoxin system